MNEDELNAAFKRIANPVSPMAEAGIALYNMFQTWVLGGFTEDQALTLLAKWMVESGRRGSETDDA